MDQKYIVLERNGFRCTKKTAKASEFTHIQTKEVIYTLPSVTINIVVNPDLVEQHKNLIEQAEIYHNAALTQFPKKNHTGQQPIHYGYQFKFETLKELGSFLVTLESVIHNRRDSMDAIREIQTYQNRFNPGLKRNQVISNREIVEIFKCGNMGGMRRSHTTNTLVIVSDYTKGLYHDKWQGDVLHYTGMGKNGDQRIDTTQNKTLNESNTNGVGVFLFEVFKAGEYTFLGEVKLCATPYQTNQPGENGSVRKVWIFPIKAMNEQQEQIDEQLAKEVAAEVAPIEANSEIETTEKVSLIKTRIGHGVLKKKLLQQEGKCKICGLSDERFLIASHIKPWSQSTNKERLDLNNVLLLCPHHDAAFDKGYISFTDEGKLCISSEISSETQALLNLIRGKKIKLDERSKEYIKWHMKYIFKG